MALTSQAGPLARVGGGLVVSNFFQCTTTIITIGKTNLFAHELRQNMTKAEACLWKYALKARKMKGYSFRRQRPILNFIADFMCESIKLVIEVDGCSHLQDDVQKKDRIKDMVLEDAGYEILRFTDNQVLTDISNVVNEIEKYIEKFEKGSI